MGTNYYASEPPCVTPCRHCEQDDWHIGKSLTMFEAHPESPWGPIESWADWKRVLLERDLIVRDEYDVEHSVADFIKDVEATLPEVRRKQYQWLVGHGHSLAHDWLDADGFSFHRGDFC